MRERKVKKKDYGLQFKGYGYLTLTLLYLKEGGALNFNP